MPDWVANKLERLAKIEEAKAALEKGAREEAAARSRDDDDGPPAPAKPKHHADGTPSDERQRNFTDPESRILKTRNGHEQGYNAQAAVDSERQVIVAAEVHATKNDVQFIDEILVQIRANTGRQTRELSADHGSLSDANLAACARRHVEPYIATDRLRHEDGRPARQGA